MSMRYTGKKKFISGSKSRAEQIRQYKKLKAESDAWDAALKPRKSTEALKKLMRTPNERESVRLSMFKQLEKEIKKQLDSGLLAVSGRW